jgi:hypothetical protein
MKNGRVEDLKNLKKYKMKKMTILAPVFISYLFLIGCGRSYDKIDDAVLKRNEREILKTAYELITETEEYENGNRMNPPFVFDCIFSFLLNNEINKKRIPNLDNTLNKDFEVVFKKSGTYNIKDFKCMLENNVPIVQLKFHWLDPMSQKGNNNWKTYTIFFPEAKIVDGKLELGKYLKTDDIIPELDYLDPYSSEKYNENFVVISEFYSKVKNTDFLRDIKNNRALLNE